MPPELQTQLDLDNITFVSNDRLQSVMERTTAPLRLKWRKRCASTRARLRALKIGLLIMAGVALLAIFPAGKLPNFLPGEIPDPAPRKRGRNE